MKLVQFISIVVYSFIAVSYLAPWLKKLDRAEALTWLMGIHVFRYVVLYLPVARLEGYPISNTSAMQIMTGDLSGAAIALVAITLLRFRIRLGIAFAWLLAAATIADTINILHQRSIEPPRPDATGVWWLVFVFFAPLIMVSTVLIVWQLYTRRSEPLEIQ